MEKWIDVKDKLPTKTGWYFVKTRNDEKLKIPYVSTLNGTFVWVLPDVSVITHYLEN